MPPRARPIDYTIPCSACRASIDEKCSTPTPSGRREVDWTHFIRQHAADGASAK